MHFFGGCEPFRWCSDQEWQGLLFTAGGCIWLMTKNCRKTLGAASFLIVGMGYGSDMEAPRLTPFEHPAATRMGQVIRQPRFKVRPSIKVTPILQPSQWFSWGHPLNMPNSLGSSHAWTARGTVVGTPRRRWQRGTFEIDMPSCLVRPTDLFCVR